VAGYFTGIALGMVGVMTITASGVVGLVLALPGATPIVTIVAAAYFVWLPGASRPRRRSLTSPAHGGRRVSPAVWRSR
jgi:threonine/homoserine/homoserine lactone efflux protein